MAATLTVGGKRKSPKGRSFEEPLAILGTPRELNVVLDIWVAYGIFKPN